MPLTSEMLTGVEKPERNGVSQNILYHTASKPNGIAPVPSDQAPKRKAACNLEKWLEGMQNGDTKHRGSKGSHTDLQSAYKHLNALPKAAPPTVPCESGFGLHQKKDLAGDTGSESLQYSAAYSLHGSNGSKPLPRYIPTLSESRSTPTTLPVPNERRGLKVDKHLPLAVGGNVASEENQEAPVKDRGDLNDFVGKPSSCATLSYSSQEVFLHNRSQETLDPLAESVHSKPFSASSCHALPENKICQPVKWQSGHTLDLREECGYPQHRHTTDLLKADAKKLNSAAPFSDQQPPLRKATAPLLSQQDSGFDSPFINLD